MIAGTLGFELREGDGFMFSMLTIESFETLCSWTIFSQIPQLRKILLPKAKKKK